MVVIDTRSIRNGPVQRFELEESNWHQWVKILYASFSNAHISAATGQKAFIFGAWLP